MTHWQDMGLYWALRGSQAHGGPAPKCPGKKVIGYTKLQHPSGRTMRLATIVTDITPGRAPSRRGVNSGELQWLVDRGYKITKSPT